MKIREIFNDETIKGSPKVLFVKFVLILMVTWILLSGRFELKFIIYGIATSIIVAIVCMPLMIVDGISGKKKYFIFDVNVFKLAGYLVWLGWQLILANIEVAKAVVSPTLKIEPEVVRFRVHIDNPMALTMLANSITLTPGTVTMNVTEDGIFEVHALTKATAQGMIDGSMQVHVARLYREDETFEVLDSMPEENGTEVLA